MRAIYIDSSGHINSVIPKLIEGNVYNVRNSPVYDDSYVVAGFEGSSEYNFHYLKTHFIPCSEIDETQLHEQTQTQPA